MAQSKKVGMHCAIVSADKSVVENATDATIVRRETKGIPEHVFPPMQDSRFARDCIMTVGVMSKGPKRAFGLREKLGP